MGILLYRVSNFDIMGRSSPQRVATNYRKVLKENYI